MLNPKHRQSRRSFRSSVPLGEATPPGLRAGRIARGHAPRPWRGRARRSWLPTFEIEPIPKTRVARGDAPPAAPGRVRRSRILAEPPAVAPPRPLGSQVARVHPPPAPGGRSERRRVPILGQPRIDPARVVTPTRPHPYVLRGRVTRTGPPLAPPPPPGVPRPHRRARGASDYLGQARGQVARFGPPRTDALPVVLSRQAVTAAVLELTAADVPATVKLEARAVTGVAQVFRPNRSKLIIEGPS